MTTQAFARSDAWTQMGQQIAPLLGTVGAVVVAGANTEQAAAVALGIAQIEGGRRRVAIADLVGECPVLEALHASDDPHGIADSFLYGVSLNRIALPVNDAGSVFLMPSGTEPVAAEAIYGSERWRRLAMGFQQVGALLLVVAIPETPGFRELCTTVGAFLPIGPGQFPDLPGVHVIAPATPSAPSAADRFGADQPLPQANGSTGETMVLPSRPPAPRGPRAARARDAAAVSADGRRRTLIATIVALCAVAVALAAFWPAMKSRLPASIARLLAGAPADTTTLLVKPTPMDTLHRADSALLDSAKRAVDSLLAAAPDSLSRPVTPPPAIENPADSSSAARYAIFLTAANTRKDALADARLQGQSALAVAPVLLDGAVWYRVFLGAAAARPGADSLLTQLRSKRVVNGGAVADVPLAFRLEQNVAPATVATRLAELNKRGILAYALRQANGNDMIYTGAFETPAQATILADSLRALGITPVLTFRTGRVF